jgi:hypothetical protein
MGYRILVNLQGLFVEYNQQVQGLAMSVNGPFTGA